MRRLVVLGVGGWISDPRLGHTSIALDLGEEVLLLDCGEGTARALEVCGVGLSRPMTVVVTHMHGDHVLGLPTLIQLARHLGTALRVIAAPTVVDGVRRLLDLVGCRVDGVELRALEPGRRMELERYAIKLVPARHSIESYAVRIDLCEGPSILYTGDTSPSSEIAEAARGCEVLIHEASGTDPAAHAYGHSTVEDAIRCCIEAGCRRLILVHFYGEAPPIDAGFLSREAVHSIEIVVAHPCYVLEL